MPAARARVDRDQGQRKWIFWQHQPPRHLILNLTTISSSHQWDSLLRILCKDKLTILNTRTSLRITLLQWFHCTTSLSTIGLLATLNTIMTWDLSDCPLSKRFIPTQFASMKQTHLLLLRSNKRDDIREASQDLLYLAWILTMNTLNRNVSKETWWRCRGNKEKFSNR